MKPLGSDAPFIGKMILVDVSEASDRGKQINARL
jgi:hypothetical protein